jgi:hypothetical protein
MRTSRVRRGSRRGPTAVRSESSTAPARQAPGPNSTGRFVPSRSAGSLTPENFIAGAGPTPLAGGLTLAKPVASDWRDRQEPHDPCDGEEPPCGVRPCAPHQHHALRADALPTRAIHRTAPAIPDQSWPDCRVGLAGAVPGNWVSIASGTLITACGPSQELQHSQLAQDETSSLWITVNPLPMAHIENQTRPAQTRPCRVCCGGVQGERCL